MTTTGLASIVIAAYNEEAFIDEALRSALAQTYQPIEVIVVDDGSTDRTAEIAASHPVRLLRRPHRGPGAARNAGLQLARGEYWTVFDADDLMPPDRLHHQITHLTTHPNHDIVLGLTQAFVSPGQPRPPHYNPTWDTGPFPGHPGTTLGRREALEQVGLLDERRWLGDDVDWQARAKDAGIRAGHIDDICLHYRIHHANLSRDTAENRLAMLALLRESVHRRRARAADQGDDRAG